MTYPVYIGDRAAGTMTVTAAGEDHLFEVICHPPEPGLWRVWVQGEGQRLALGLLEGGRFELLRAGDGLLHFILFLRKRCSDLSASEQPQTHRRIIRRDLGHLRRVPEFLVEDIPVTGLDVCLLELSEEALCRIRDLSALFQRHIAH